MRDIFFPKAIRITASRADEKSQKDRNKYKSTPNTSSINK
jgi:hypothetical protein